MRDADLRIYDAACRLLEAAQSLSERAGERRGAAAMAPTMGCLQASLLELENAVATLSGQARVADAASVHHLPGALDDLVAVLRLAGRAADAARAAAADANRSAVSRSARLETISVDR